MRSGDPFGDHGQRVIMLALIFEPVLANEEGVGVPPPLTHQCRAGLRHDTGIERRASFLEFSDKSLKAAPQYPARPVSSALLQLMDESSDQQIATEPLRRAGAMQLPPLKPQFGCRAIEQFGNLAVDHGGVRTARSAPVAHSTGYGRRPATVLASRRVADWRRHALAGSAMR